MLNHVASVFLNATIFSKEFRQVRQMTDTVNAIEVPEEELSLLHLVRVTTAQGKQVIWLLTFQDRENTGNLENLIFYTGKIVATQEKF